MTYRPVMMKPPKTEPEQRWVLRDYAAGLNERVKDSDIADSQASSLQNVVCSIIGKLNPRSGQAKLNADAVGTAALGLHGYYYGDPVANRKLIAVFNDGTMYYWGGSSFTSTGKTGLNASAPVLFETTVNYLVAMNGVNAPFKYDGSTVSALANAPATGKCPVLFAEKLFCISDQDTVMWSDSFAPESWPGVNVIDVDRGDGDELSALFRFGTKLLICKKTKLYVLSGSSLDDFRLTNPEKLHGVAGPRAGVVIDPYFYHISKDGIFRFDGLESVDLTNPPGAELPGIPVTWGNVNKAVLDKAVAGIAGDFIWFHVAESPSTTNNLVLAYNRKFGSWWVHRGITASCMAEYNDGSTIKTYTGGAASGFVIQQGVGSNDLGAAIESYWIGKNFDGGLPAHIKKTKKAFVVDANGANDVTFKYRLNHGSWQTPTAATDTNNVRKYSIASGKYRYFQPQFYHNTLDQTFAVTGLEIPYKVTRKPK